MNIQDISGLISIQTFLAGSIDNFNIKLSKEEIKNIQNKVQQLNKIIIDASLKFDTSSLDQKIVQRTFTSSEDPEVVLKKLMTNGQKGESKTSKSVK